jgi:aminopeptidase
MDLSQGSRTVVEKCLKIQKDEKVLIVTDENKLKMAQSLFEAVKNARAKPFLLMTVPGKVSGEEPDEITAKAMLDADVVICPTSVSMTHTNARINAVKNGVRVATMPGITEEMFSKGAITADYEEVEKLTLKITDMLTAAKTAKIVKGEYTLRMSLENRNGVPSTGVYDKKGTAGNLPSGEAYIAPVEGTANGEMLIDGSMVGIGKLESPLYMRIENGHLKEIKGENSEKISILLENENNSSLGELGIGTNKSAILCGIILEDEKVYGTVHIAFGTNTSFGGNVKADCHMDGVILRPDLYLDDVLIMKNGEIIV